MADSYKRPYLESSVFISWVQREVRDGVDRHAVVDHILRQARRGEFRIFTSSFTLAEVHKARHCTPLSDQQDEDILSLFEHPFIVLVELDWEVGQQANRLCRQLTGLKPPDAVHLSSAIRAECDVLLSWDGDLADLSHPQMPTERPQMLGKLELPMMPEENLLQDPAPDGAKPRRVRKRSPRLRVIS